MVSTGKARFLDIVTTSAEPASARPALLARGFELRWSVRQTPFGAALAAASPFGLCAFEFLGEDALPPIALREALLAKLAARWGDANLAADDSASSANASPASASLAAAFEAVASGSPLAGSHHSPILHLRGTAFQIAVWRKLLTIPSGSLATYGELAASLGAPKASRAVGSAVGANPIAIFVPCHRVVAASGALGGYRWGTSLKQALLDRERR